MAFSKRIKALASLVDKNANVIDVGCDHGLLDVYLTLYNNNTCTACDIKQSALNSAINNFKKYNLDIKTIVSNGLENVEVPFNSTIVIAGMGTSTIIDILKNDKVEDVKSFIIQTNNDYFELRKYMIKKGFFIKDEIALIDKNIRYVIIKFERGIKKYSRLELKIGPILLIKDDQDTKNYFKDLYLENKKIIKKIPNRYFVKRIELIIINKKIKKLI